jgi:DNA-binding transcriptional MerR regulator
MVYTTCMETHLKAYTVHQLAKLAAVSVRTLHHYDHIGLLKPSSHSSAGYRLYGETDLLRLQQILFYRELEIPLSDIRGILDQPGFDLVQALESQRTMLQKQAERLASLMITIDKTIAKLTHVPRFFGVEETMELSDAELYEGFSKEQIERYEREVRQRYDPQQVAESNKRVRKMSKEQWQVVKQEGETITQLMAERMECDPGSPEVQAIVARHHTWIENFYPAPADYYRGLGQLYVEHEEFRAHYDNYRIGLADFMKSALDYFCDHTLN